MLKSTYCLPDLPPKAELETVHVMKALARASRALAELKGRAATIPNQGILIDTLVLQEARASSEVENIVTTQDELFQADVFPEGPQSPAAKEVSRYRDALRLGYQRLRESRGLITNNTIIEMFQLLKCRDEGFRETPGTALKNETTREIIYVPPQEAQAVKAAMAALENYMNNGEGCSLDPLIKMALIHHQFESIHPFSDGNGRIGRILNVLYLTKEGLLDIPILYLSRHITSTKSEYYRLLQEVRDDDAWEKWTIYMLEGVESTAKTTLQLVEGIRAQMTSVKHRMRKDFPGIYSQDIINNLFRHPYTRIDFVQKDLGVTRQTAAKYLDTLAQAGFVEKRQSGKSNYYINTELVRLFISLTGDR